MHPTSKVLYLTLIGILTIASIGTLTQVSANVRERDSQETRNSDHADTCTQLQKRSYYPPIPSRLWLSYLRRGERMLGHMWAPLELHVTQPQVFSTPWTNWADVENYGWWVEGLADSNNQEEPIEEGNLDDVRKCLSELGVPITNPPNVWIEFDHTLHSRILAPDGRPYQVTRAWYEFYVNPENGVFVINNAFSPRHRVEELRAQGINFGPTVPLQRLSDFMYLAWDRLATSDEKQNIKHVIINHLENRGTRAAVASAFRQNFIDQIPDWPGVTFRLDSEHPSPEALALLGTDNIHGIARFLYQHTAELGHKVIESITLWDEQPNLSESDRRDIEACWINALIRITAVSSEELVPMDDVSEYAEPDDE